MFKSKIRGILRQPSLKTTRLAKQFVHTHSKQLFRFMQRRDFIAQLGLGAAFVLTASCLGSCKKSDTGPVDFTLDLEDAANAALKTNGNYLVTNQVVVARGIDGNYYAATVVCSHEQKKQITYNKSQNAYYCTEHGARFDLAGNGLNGNGSGGLEVYQTALSGTTLRIFS